MEFKDVIFGWFIGVLTVVIALILADEPIREFKSSKKVTPKYELVVKNNVVDTVWVYKIE